MPELNEGKRAGEFIASEANGTRSRDVVIIALGAGALVPGTVLGKITASGKFAAVAPAAVDGSEKAAGILYHAIDATAADAEAVGIVRDAEVNGSELTWPAGMLAAEKTAAIAELAALGIIVR